MLDEEQKTNVVVRTVGPYTLYETLGKGGYSWVKRGVIEDTKAVYALKFVQKVDVKFLHRQAKQVHSEIVAMMRVNNPYVIKLYAYNLMCKYPAKSGKTANTILLVLEYCPGGDIFEILYYTHQFHPIIARTYFVQLMTGLKACHDVGIVHRDIKPQNLLLDCHYQLKIADFGLSFVAKTLENMAAMKTRCGTRGYQAPELIKGETYTKSCDIFSCGVVLFILIVGHPPFERAWRVDKWYRPMCDLNPGAFWRGHKRVKVAPDCKDLLSGMLAYRAKNRLTLDEVLNHKWVAKRPILNESQLEKAVRKKHKEARRLRRNDTAKIQKLEDSVKQRKKRIISNLAFHNLNNGFELPVVENLVPTLLTFFAKKRYLHEAYEAAVNVFREALKGNSQTISSKETPWNVRTLVKVSNGESEQKFVVVL